MEARRNSLLFYKNCLLGRIGSSECLNDLLISMLHVIPLHHIKQFISQQIDELDLNRCKNVYYTQMSMDEIFPSDIIQYILSFGGLYHTKAVNKKWRQYSEQNEQIHLTKLYSSVNKIISPVKYDETINKTYIINQHRTKLHKMETDLRYKGPMKDIKKTLQICNSGDRLLVHDGDYNVSCLGNSFLQIDFNIQLIGVGAAVTIKYSSGRYWYVGKTDLRGTGTGTETKCDIRNIKFDFWNMNMCRIGFLVQENATLHLENCEVACGEKYRENAVVWAAYGSHLNINNCRFIGHGSDIAIELSPSAKEVNIIDCTFENCGIKITDAYDRRVNDEMVQLKCVGNIFDLDNNSLGDFHPITEIRVLNDNYLANSDQYTLKDNLLKVTSENDVVNPNTIKIREYL